MRASASFLRSVVGLLALAAMAACGGSTGGGTTTQCSAGQLLCSGACVDPMTDHDHCGAGAGCTGGTACGQGQVCNAGACDTSCPAGQVVCGNRCVDPLTDRAHCGADAACQGFTACASGQVCADGACATSCPPGQYDCDGKCIDPATDRAYCGADASCQGYTTCADGQVCAAGHCAASCPNGQYACGGKCIDPQTDRAWCGASSSCQGYTTCGAGQVCATGHCATSCPQDQYACGGKCVDPQSDRAWCGANASCQGFTSCGPGQVCSRGACTTSCPEGQYACGGKCIDPASDPNYCGAAEDCTGGHVCGTGSFCNAGSCWSPCPGAGEALCGGQCVDATTNRGFCGASGLCAGGAEGVSCAPDQICSVGKCACPEGQVPCNGSCRFGACGDPAPDFEWKASVPLTAVPRFQEPSSVIAHIVFNGTNMEDLTGHTTWTKVGNPPSYLSGMWASPQYASGPFTETDHWVGDGATRDYLMQTTRGLFSVCARFKPGQFPVNEPNKIIFSLGKAEYDGTATPRGGWALMQMHESACFHYTDSVRGEWMMPNGYTMDGNTVASLEWAWFCGGIEGDPANAQLGNQRESAFTSGQWSYGLVGGQAPLQVYPAVTGFPSDTDVPAIGAYPDGTHPLSDGMVYEVIITADPATPENLSRIVARAEGGMEQSVESPAFLTGADGMTHLGPPSTVRVEPDGSILANQNVLLVPDLPPTFDPVTNGQCWGVEVSAADWTDASAGGALLAWSNEASNRSLPGARALWLEWNGTSVCLWSPGGFPSCGDRGTQQLPNSRHKIQGCVAPDLSTRVYFDGAPVTDGLTSLADATWIAHLEDPTSTFVVQRVSPSLKVWRVWACQGSDPAACP